MKAILAYGDSNTWGYVPGAGERFPRAVRWTGVLQSLLGERFLLIEEGLNGRTTVWDDPFKPGRNGFAALMPVLETHAPLDLVVVMLGTNDLKHYRSAHAADSARGAAMIVEAIGRSACGPASGPPQVLLVSPPRIGTLSAALQLQFRDAPAKSAQFAGCYRDVAAAQGCRFLDAAEVVAPSDRDGVHLDAEGHRRLAEALAAIVIDVLAGED